MRLLVLCCWSSLLIFVWLIRSKYRWTRPPGAFFLACMMAGAVATLPSLLGNAFLSRETQLWVFSGNRWHSFLGFLLGAGLGEEFWKMGCGLIAILCWPKRLNPADRALGLVLVGLTFGSAENLLSYGAIGALGLLFRGLVSVPLHAAMGLVHGLSANQAIARRRAWPLFAGLGVAVAIHTFCDTWRLALPDANATWIAIGVTLILVAWSVIAWRRVPEIDPTWLQNEHAGMAASTAQSH